MHRRTEQWGYMLRYAGSTAGVNPADLEVIAKTSKKGATTRRLFFYIDNAKQEVSTYACMDDSTCCFGQPDLWFPR